MPVSMLMTLLKFIRVAMGMKSLLGLTGIKFTRAVTGIKLRTELTGTKYIPAVTDIMSRTGLTGIKYIQAVTDMMWRLGWMGRRFIPVVMGIMSRIGLRGKKKGGGCRKGGGVVLLDMGKNKCSKCSVEYEYEDQFVDIIILDEYQARINLDILDNENARLNTLYFNIMDYIRNHSIKKFTEKYVYSFNQERLLECPICGTKDKKYYDLSFGSNFNWFLYQYIYYTIDDIVFQKTKKSVNVRISDIGGLIYDETIINSIITSLPLKYSKEKKYLLKLQKTMKMLPADRGGGDPFDTLEWLIVNIKSEIFGIVLSMFLAGGISILKNIIKKIKIRKLIKKKIKINTDFWKDISFEEIRKYMEIPENYKQSKEQLIKRIIEVKTKEYEEELVEKFRN